MAQELWKDIIGYEGDYKVSNLGNIKSFKYDKIDGRILKLTPDKDGHLGIRLSKNGVQKIYKVHRLVMQAFDPIYGMENLTVNHKDENKTNNCLTNLEWMTRKEQTNYGTCIERMKQAKGKKVIDTYTGITYSSITEAANAANVNKSYVSKICKKQVKTQGRYRWIYADGGNNGK